MGYYTREPCINTVFVVKNKKMHEFIKKKRKKSSYGKRSFFDFPSANPTPFQGISESFLLFSNVQPQQPFNKKIKYLYK